MLSTLCSAPFAHQHIDTNGEVRICCAFKSGAHKDSQGATYNVTTHTLEESWNSDYIKQLRLDLIAGKKPDACSACWNLESSDNSRGQSVRIGTNRRIPIANIQDRLAYAIEHNGEVKEPALDFQIMTGNLCNLACKMCSPRFSTQWSKFFSNAGYTDINDIQFTKNNINIQYDVVLGEVHDWPVTNPLSNVFENSYQNIQFIFFTGGEPTLIAENIEFLNFLVEKQVSKNIHIRVSTNVTNINKKLLDILSNFKKVSFNLSIDGIGDILHIQRYPADWATVEHNMKTLLEWSSKHNDFCVHRVWTSLNFHQLNDFLNYFIKLKENNDYPQIGMSAFLSQPKFSIAEVPKVVRDKVYEEFVTLKPKVVSVFGQHLADILEYYLTSTKFADDFEQIHYTLDLVQQLHPELNIRQIYSIYYE